MRSKILALSLLLAACTQQPAQVVNKGHDRYGQNNSSSGNAHSTYTTDPQGTYVPPASEPVHMAQPAEVNSIGISDLPPPPKAEKTEAPKPVAKIAETKTETPAAAPATTVKPFPTEQPKSEAKSGLAWPSSSHKVTSAYSKSTDGITIATESGEPVYAADAGEVVFSGAVKNFGTTVIVKHRGGRTTTYAHLTDPKVEKYDRVNQGDILGYSGKEPLYFSVRDGKDSIDPKPLLK